VDLDPLEIDEDDPEYDEEDAAEEQEWYAGSLRIVEVLLEAGANAALTDGEGQTPLHIAVYCGNLEVVKLLVAHGAPLDAADAAGKKPLDLTDDEEIKAALAIRER
jgi:ankyrin repeat protein